MPDQPNEQIPDNNHADAQFDNAALTAPIAAPVAGTPDHEPQPWLQPNKPKSRKKWLIIAAITVLGLGGGGAVYALWYQSPDKIVMDAIANAVTAKTATVKGSYSGMDEQASYRVSFDGKGGYEEGAIGVANVAYTLKDNAEVKVSVAGIYSPSGDDYVKVSNLKQIFAPMLAQIQQGGLSPSPSSSLAATQTASLYMSFLQPLIDRVDDKWLKFSTADLKKVSAKTGDSYECVEELVKNTKNDYGKLIELGVLYQKNSFLVIKQSLGAKNGNVGYLVAVDNGKLKTFIEDLKTSNLYKSLKSCPKTLSMDADILKGKETLGVELWIDQLSHELRTVHAKDGDKLTFDATLTFNKPVEVAVPQSFVSLSAIINEMMQMFGGSLNSFFKSD